MHSSVKKDSIKESQSCDDCIRHVWPESDIYRKYFLIHVMVKYVLGKKV